ncbi:ribosome biogenesis factor YjgA [Thiomicrorhabdus aquaedulcis]|uniref:ribosome biogenesis factor YjgA n=1 Tax=Thiomicrorhabdus aquaedulcis TaxID=2211106 RepID=UPI000FDC90A5|nr:ribosome biogenesis factor YjgA [Thiomicrorhabdus aquaedulcis]
MVRSRNVNRKTAKKEVPDWEQEEFKSRTQVRDAAQAVTDMGEELAALTDNEIKRLQLPEDITKALLFVKTMDRGPALKRQKLFIGRTLRQDEDLIIEIKTKLAEIDIKKKQQNAHFHKLEQWRDRMIEEGDGVLAEFLELYTQADRQQLRQWIRNAQKEREQELPAKASKEIFKYLRSLEW